MSSGDYVKLKKAKILKNYSQYTSKTYCASIPKPSYEQYIYNVALDTVRFSNSTYGNGAPKPFTIDNVPFDPVDLRQVTGPLGLEEEEGFLQGLGVVKLGGDGGFFADGDGGDGAGDFSAGGGGEFDGEGLQALGGAAAEDGDGNGFPRHPGLEQDGAGSCGLVASGFG